MKNFESPTLGRKFESVVFGILDMSDSEEGGVENPAIKDTSRDSPTLTPGHPPINDEPN
jgi:hypothetical protein